MISVGPRVSMHEHSLTEKILKVGKLYCRTSCYPAGSGRTYDYNSPTTEPTRTAATVSSSYPAQPSADTESSTRPGVRSVRFTSAGSAGSGSTAAAYESPRYLVLMLYTVKCRGGALCQYHRRLAPLLP